MANRISDTIKKLFPNDFEELVPVQPHWWDRIDFSTLHRQKWGWLGLGLLLAFAMIPSAFFFNRFVTLETQVQTQKAQIEAHVQRRQNILINLSQTLIDYARHEQGMFRFMAETRAESLVADGKTPQQHLQETLQKIQAAQAAGTSGEKLSGMMGSIMALAENYPQLKLNENFQKMMDALVDVEDRIVERRMAYNEACNVYGTYIRKFPQFFYAFLFRFKPYPFITSDDDTTQLKWVTTDPYQGDVTEVGALPARPEMAATEVR
ncbi:MAG: LemA family protein [Candidatus Omnitrophica bacterium]|nr:LemA family protein [Candidatus Omnitrophota bacterium]